MPLRKQYPYRLTLLLDEEIQSGIRTLRTSRPDLLISDLLREYIRAGLKTMGKRQQKRKV